MHIAYSPPKKKCQMQAKNKSIDKSCIIDYGKILQEKKTPEPISPLKNTDSAIKRKESMLTQSIKNRFEELKLSMNSMTFKVPGQEISPPEYQSKNSDHQVEISNGKPRSLSQKTELE